MGYFPELEKSMLITTQDQADCAASQLEHFQLMSASGYRYLGGFISPQEHCKDWIRPQIKTWKHAVHDLTIATNHFLQTPYAGFSKSLQSKWQYLQHMIPDIGNMHVCP